MPLSAQQSDFIEKFIGVSQKIQKAIAATAAKEGEASRPEAGGVPTGTVKKRAFMIERWKKVPGELKAGVEQLSVEIEEIAPWQDAKGIAKSVENRLHEIVDYMQEQVANGFDKDVQSGDGAYSETIAAIDSAAALFDSDPLLADLRQGDVVPGDVFIGKYESALNEIRSTLSA